MDLITWRERLGIVGTSNVSNAGSAATIGTPRLEVVLPPASRPEGRLTEEAKKQLGEQLLEAAVLAIAEAGVPITDGGLAAVCGPLQSFFATGLESASDPHAFRKVDGTHLGNVLTAVLSDRFSDYRWRFGETDPQLASLSAAQREEWMRPAEYLSIRLSPESKDKLAERARTAAGLASAALIGVQATLGSLDAARARHSAVVEELRQIPKDDRERRIAGGEAAKAAASDVNLLENLTELSQLDPATADPARMEKIGRWLAQNGGRLGAESLAGFAAALETGDLDYQRGRTFEDPPASTRFKLSAIGCMSWPDPAALSECIDANKHLICTDSPVYGIVQGSLRIVDRRDGTGPALILERLYPDAAVEEKRRLIEHALQRAAGLGVPLLLPEEYFWSCDRWMRVAPEGSMVKIPPMNDAIQEIARSFEARLIEPQVVEVKATIGPVGTEYIDSAPVGGAKNRGQPQVRRYGPQEALFDNAFVVLVPKSVEWNQDVAPAYEFQPLFNN